MAAADHRHGRTVHRLLSDDLLRLLEAARGNRRAHAADRSASQSANRETGRRRNCSGKFQRACARRRMDERRRNYKSGIEHGWWIDVERDEFDGTTETKRVAALGIQLANARSAGKPNADCSRDRFTRPNATGGPRS